MTASPFRRAWRGLPSRRVGLFSELRGEDEGILEIDRVFDNRCHNHPDIGFRLLEDVVILREFCLVAVRHAVPAKISRTHIHRCDLQAPRFRCAGRCLRAMRNPGGYGVTLPRTRPARRFGLTEMKEPC